MSVQIVKRWLAEQIRTVDSVQKCVLDQGGADIVVHSWRGVLIHIHLVTEPLKVRNLKRLMQEATRIGIGTLFVVDARLMPPDGATLAPPDWLMAIHALSDDKVYTFRMEADGPRIAQVHFRIPNREDEREIWYGPDIAIRQLPFYRVWVKLPTLKGDFLIANFGSDPFWRHPDYRNAREFVAQQQRRQRVTEAYEFGYGGMSTPELIQRAVDPKLVSSYASLGLSNGAPCEEVKSAYRKLARTVHPDTSGLPKEEAERRFKQVTDAYNYIRDKNGC